MTLIFEKVLKALGTKRAGTNLNRGFLLKWDTVSEVWEVLNEAV
jgi:hypothetical protein